MKNFGKNVNIKSKKKKTISEKETLIDIIILLEECFVRSSLLEQNNLNIMNYEESFYVMIENLLYLKYGENKTDIILWWVYDRFYEEGEIKPIKILSNEDGGEKEIVIQTAEQLYEFLKQIDNQEIK
jgi:predicted DNA-binding antitoxin AbrB/MazE fold protein